MTGSSRTARVADIITIAAQLSGVPIATITGRSRLKLISRVRQAVCYVGWLNGHSSSQIGAKIGRDHSTVLHGTAAAAEWAKRNPAYRDFLQAIDFAALNAVPLFKPSPAHYFEMPPLGTPLPIPVNPPKANRKPKNDFRAEADTDDIHRRDCARIAAGSQLLAAAITKARAV